MATTIMGGLMVATVLTLFFLPALYALAFRTRDEAPATAAKPAAADPMSGAAAAPAE